MVRRLSQVYLPVWIGFAPAWLTQAIVGLVASGIAFLIRAILELAWPGVAPFALLFPATLIATLLAGWPAGAWVTISGGLWTWYAIFPPQGSLAMPGPSEIVSFALFAIASAIVAVFADAYRRSAGALERERLQQLSLINELNHRVKNTLATVQSVAAQTLGRSEVDQAAKAALQDRILALSRAHDVLTSHAWEKASLREIASQATAPYQAGGQISVAGPDVSLSPSQALALAMAFHELATNAAKYGALSVLAGRVSIAWALESEHLRVSWVERSGPPVIFRSRRGFGRRLLEQGLVRELRADVRLSFQAAGLSCEISAPMAARELAAERAVPLYSPRS